ncbi:hypothetical protein DI09_9p120 [Mitosporidium daphniae]|uniref:tRNA(His) guanylyltransferase n=1 Tax=Mitosporidium daphniae TaxID=1485682 RepID=A0A098VMD0_9MICR|nr:uncharacterized protein DI09_9p120 [Mitosporidium daphniae]KGG49929.1 hypothetical protein DI09_9p120 [Mitosporidium daphniae]|eukprot:XP_013236356.1 uncharacterized protein DI09_9p120 [Mitosporidium daphniae]
MANSKFEYIRTFEIEDHLLKDIFLVVRIDGRSFHKYCHPIFLTRFSEKHCFTKPNDKRALALMNRAAQSLMSSFADIIIAYGQSDEYSKILSTIVSTFTAVYMFHWGEFFEQTPMLYPATFDGRIVLYPTLKHIRDYLSWRQVDCRLKTFIIMS